MRATSVGVMQIVATGLRFPEGPVWVDAATVVVTEIAAGSLTAVDVATASTTRVVQGLAGPNGLALDPGDPTVGWVADNGGYFAWHDTGELLLPMPGGAGHTGGALRRVALDSGGDRSGDVVVGGDDARLVAPNDVVVDAGGGVWFTDFGVQHGTAAAGQAGVWYLAPGGSAASAVVWGTHQANGIGLSADGTELYVAETHSASLWAFAVTGPGAVAGGGSPGRTHDGRLVHRADGFMFDSLAVDPDGWVCVATIGPGGGVTCVEPVSGATRRVTAPDDLTTNVCFWEGGGLVRAALTLSSTGALAVADDWRRLRDAS